MFTNTSEFPILGGEHQPLRLLPGLSALIPVLIVAVAVFMIRAFSPTLGDASSHESLRILAGTVTDFALRSSHNGVYRGEVTAAEIGGAGSHVWTVHLEQRNHRRLANADVRVRLSMPDSEIEAGVPVAKYVGAGNYRIEDVSITHRGWWNLALIVDGRSGIDSMAFNIRLP